MNNTIQVPHGMAAKQEAIPVKVKYCLYARKGSESEERQVLSIDSQIKEMLQLAEREGLEIVTMKRESHSAKETGQRPVFNEIVEEVRNGKYNGILTWAPDRISRNAGDLGRIVDLMDEKKLSEIRTYGQTFNNSPNEKFLLMILCSQAKLENDNKSINVKRGLKTRVEMGLWPGPVPTGYFKEKRVDRRCECIIDPERAPIIKQMFEKVAYEKWSGKKLYNWLRFDLNFRTAAGKKHLSLGNVFTILYNTFYYGSFEYPRKSGNWYQGKHPPLITKELFDLVQQQMRSNAIRTENKEFAFTKHPFRIPIFCGTVWMKFECISGKIRRILTNDTCASHAPFGRDPKTKNFLTIPFSAGGVGGAGKKWKGKFLVLVPTLHSSRKDLYLYFSIVAIFCPSFPPSFASVRGAPISAFCGNSSVRSHFATTSHRPFAFAHDACSVFASCSLCGFD